MQKETFDITPDISLMPKLGKSGYSSPQAIAELVDNSIDARIDGELLEVNIKIDKNVISIADNGSGMNKDELVKALTLAYSEKKEMLGEFGLGLKTSCNSLGENFEIITTPRFDNKQYKINYSQKEWINGKRKWEIDVESEKSEDDLHFTIVKVTSLYSHWPQLAEVLKKDLEKRFSPFIDKNIINIKVNGKKCKSNLYELIEDSRKEFRVKVKEINNDHENVIYGWYGLLKEGSNKGLYGFHTYRRGRMITTYDKIGIGEHPTISRIIGEINLDFVPVTHNKREFEKESTEYLLAEKYLKEEFKELVKDARKKSNQDKITKRDIDEIEIWQKKISQVMATNSELKFYTSQIDNKTGMVKDVQNGEDFEMSVEKRDEGESLGTINPKLTDTIRMPKKQNLASDKRKIVKIKGQKFEFSHKFVSLGINSSWKSYEFDKIKKTIVIFTNTDFPAYTSTKDPIFYAVLHIAEAISEIMVNEVGEEIGKIQEIKEIILKSACALKEQI